MFSVVRLFKDVQTQAQASMGVFVCPPQGTGRALHAPSLPCLLQLTNNWMWKRHEVAALGGQNEPGAPDQRALLPRPVHWVHSPSLDIRLKVSSSDYRAPRFEFGLLGLQCGWRGRLTLLRCHGCFLLLHPVLVVLARMLPTVAHTPGQRLPSKPRAGGCGCGKV